MNVGDFTLAQPPPTSFPVPRIPVLDLGRGESFRKFPEKEFPNEKLPDDLRDSTTGILDRLERSNRGTRTRTASYRDFTKALLGAVVADANALVEYLTTWARIAPDTNDTASLHVVLRSSLTCLADLETRIMNLSMRDKFALTELADLAAFLKHIEIPTTPFIQPVLSWFTVFYSDMFIRAVNLSSSASLGLSVVYRHPALDTYALINSFLWMFLRDRSVSYIACGCAECARGCTRI